MAHRIHVRYIYGNIYHQYTPFMLVYIYTSTMDPSWVVASAHRCPRRCVSSLPLVASISACEPQNTPGKGRGGRVEARWG
jgi:hypothetical protein